MSGRTTGKRWLVAGLCALPGSLRAQVADGGVRSAQVREADRLFREGSAAFTVGKMPEAEAAFARLVRVVPGMALAHTAYGTVLRAEGRTRAAEAEFAAARRADPHDAQAAVSDANALVALGEDTQAVSAFKSVPPDALASEDIVAWAAALVRMSDVSGADSVLRDGMRRAPANALLLDATGALQAQLGKYDAAGESFRAAIAADSTLAKAHADLGSLLLIRGDAAGAAQELGNAQRLGDSDLQLRVQLGRALSAVGRDEEAEAVLRAAVAAQPASIDAAYSLGLALQASGNVDGALPLLANAAAERPGDASVLTNYALALVQTGDARTALGLYNRALKIAGPNTTLREDTGAAFLQTNDIDHALEQFQAGVQADPQSAQLHYDLGLAFKLKDNLAAAVPELRRAEALDAALPDPPYTLGVILMQQGQASAAATELQKALAMRPGNGETWALFGSVLKDAGQTEQAKVALRKAIELTPEQPSPHVQLAALLAAQGDRAGALAERKQAAELSRVAVGHQRAAFALDSGRTLLKEGKLDQAVLQLQVATAAEPGMREGHLLLAEAYTKQGLAAEALAERKKAEVQPAAEKRIASQ